MLFDENLGPTTLMYRSLGQLDYAYEEERQQQPSFLWPALSTPCRTPDASPYAWLALDDELDATAMATTAGYTGGGLPAKTPAFEILPECVSFALEDDHSDECSCDSGSIFKYKQPRRKTTATTITTLDGDDEEHDDVGGSDDMLFDDHQLVVPPPPSRRGVAAQQQLLLMSRAGQAQQRAADEDDCQQQQQLLQLDVCPDAAIMTSDVPITPRRTTAQCCNSATHEQPPRFYENVRCCIDLNTTTMMMEQQHVCGSVQGCMTSNVGGALVSCDRASVETMATTLMTRYSPDGDARGRGRRPPYDDNEGDDRSERTNKSDNNDNTRIKCCWNLWILDPCFTRNDRRNGCADVVHVDGATRAHRRAPPTSCLSLMVFSRDAGKAPLRLEDGPPVLFFFCVFSTPMALLSSVALPPLFATTTTTTRDVSVLPRHQLQNSLRKKTLTSDAITPTASSSSLTGFASVNFTKACRCLLVLKGFFFANSHFWRRFFVRPSFGVSVRIFMSVWFLLMLHHFPRRNFLPFSYRQFHYE